MKGLFPSIRDYEGVYPTERCFFLSSLLFLSLSFPFAFWGVYKGANPPYCSFKVCAADCIAVNYNKIGGNS